MAAPGLQAGLTLEGLAELHDQMRKVAPEAADKAAAAAVLAIAERAERRIFRRLQNHAKSGRLMHSLFVRRRQEDLGLLAAEVRGGATAPYLLIQEFGTSRTPAQPSIVPAVEETRPEVPALMREVFAAQLEKALARNAKRYRVRG